MIENLKRIREPLTWAVLAIVAANLVLGVVQVVLHMRQNPDIFAAFAEAGGSLLNVSLLIALVALVCTCFFITPATPHALLVTMVAAVVTTIGVLLTLISTVLGLVASVNTVSAVLEIIGGLLDLALKALAAGVLWVLIRGVHAGRIDTAAAAAPRNTEPLPPASTPATTWQRDEAAGAVWRTAEDAATGAPGATRMPEAGDTPGMAIFRDSAERPASPSAE